MTRTRRHQTHLHLPLSMGGTGLVAALFVAGLMVYEGTPILQALVLALAVTAFTCALGFLISWQRVVVDPGAGTLRFAGISTWHRWRSLPMADIDELVYDDYQNKRRAMVSGLLIYMKRADGRRRRHRLMDHSLGGFRGPSPLFREIAAAVLVAQPRVDIDPVLLRRDGGSLC